MKKLLPHQDIFLSYPLLLYCLQCVVDKSQLPTLFMTGCKINKIQVYNCIMLAQEDAREGKTRSEW